MDTVKDHALAAKARAWEVGGTREIREQQQEECLAVLLPRIGKTTEVTGKTQMSAPWKVAVADDIKRTTQVSNG